MKKITTLAELEEVLVGNEPYILFKHSTTCPISSGAFIQFEEYRGGSQAVPAYYLHVQEARDVSNRIAEHFGVRHESPQVLYIRDGKAVWHTSHWKIKKETLQENIG